MGQWLETHHDRHNRQAFIATDPISIPHGFSRRQDMEIMGFWAATLAWGQRPTILAKCRQLIAFMDGSPHEFILHHQPADLRPFLDFRHRTFNATDALYFIHFFREHYRHHDTLETAFTQYLRPDDLTIERSLTGFHEYFFGLDDAPPRTRKHVATPARGSACKRLNMFLRWMVRHDDRGVDLGLWKNIRPDQLVCPIDVHAERTARHLGLVSRRLPDWQMALELTNALRAYDPADPVRFDFALFGSGANP